MLKRNLHISQWEQIMDSILHEFYSNMRRLTEENNLSDNAFWDTL